MTGKSSCVYRLLKLSAVVVCAGLAARSARAAITNVVVRSGEAFTVTGTGADGINVRGSTIDAQGGATLRFEPTSGFANCWYSIQATNGLVTLDVSADAAADVTRRFRAVYTSGTGGFRVKGATRVSHGRDDDSGQHIPFEAGNFGFVDANGAATAGEIVFDSHSFITALPIDSALKCTYRLASTNLVLGGDNLFGLTDGQVWTSSVAQVRLASTNVVPAACRVRSAKGGTIILSPGSPAPFGSSIQETWISTVAPPTNVELDEGTLLMGQLLRRYDGVVTGRGTVTEGYSSVSLVRVGADSDVVVSSALRVRSMETGARTLRAPVGSTRFRSDAGTTVALREWHTWDDKIASWFDPSQTGTCQNVGHFTGHAGECDYFYTNDYMLVEGIVDCRGTNNVRRRLILDRLVLSGAEGEFPDFYPYLVPNGLNGRSYLSFGVYRGSGTRTYTRISNGKVTSKTDSTGERRRLWTTTATGVSGSSYKNVKMIVMVFGSQQGGGAAMLATSDQSFRRGSGDSKSMEHSLSDPIANSNTHKIWLDGEAIADNTKASFSGGWQVVSAQVDGPDWTGIGAPGDIGTHQDCGGQNYGEILVFTNTLSDAERASAEWYLARKWGLAAQYKGTEAVATNRLEAVGNGMVDVTAYDEIELGGDFDGTVLLGGGTLAVPDELTPHTASTLPTLNRTGWFDPSCRDHISLLSDESAKTKTPDYVVGLWNRDTEVKADNVRYFAQGLDSTRRPCYVTAARGLGSECGWIDNNHTLYPEAMRESSSGNALRMRRWNGTFCAGSDDGAPFQTAFIIQDSVRGGGTPILDSYTAGGLIKSRATSNPSLAIWSSGTSSDITGGTVRLNGDVRAAANGFTGDAELFSFSTINSRSVNAVSLGYFYSSEYTDSQNGEIFGEMIFYDGLIGDADRKRIEGYLMGKWLGIMPAGVSDPTGATIAGTGLVTSKTSVRLPKFDESFSGTVQITDATLAMTYDAASDSFAGTILAPAATLDCPAECTIVLDIPARPNVKRYTLVSGAGWTRNVTWILQTSGAAATRRTMHLTADPSASEVFLDVSPSGMMFIVR